MKKLHLLTSKDALRPKFSYIQIKDGFVIATDTFKCAKFPFSEVFGNLETELNEFYINGENWKKCKFYNALKFTIENNYLTGYDKKGKMGICEILTKQQFEQSCGQYPDTNFLFVENENEVELPFISFSPEHLYNLCEAIGGYAFKYIFFGLTKKIKIESKDSEIKAVLMPTMF